MVLLVERPQSEFVWSVQRHCFKSKKKNQSLGGDWCENRNELADQLLQARALTLGADTDAKALVEQCQLLLRAAAGAHQVAIIGPHLPGLTAMYYGVITSCQIMRYTRLLTARVPVLRLVLGAGVRDLLDNGNGTHHSLLRLSVVDGHQDSIT